MSPLVVVSLTLGIIVLSAFFVAVEFALIGAKRHRLEEAAVGSASARAALRSANELTLLLAGSQLGITMCTLALGAITKPAVHDWLMPVFGAFGLGATAANVVAFVLALAVVTFVHLVVGEMAPKSWAIGHPETAATLLALPMRAFMWVTRPALRMLNGAANATLARFGVEPTDHVAGSQNADDLRALVEHSANVGSLDPAHSAQITVALELADLTVADLVSAAPTDPMILGADATVAHVQQAARDSGHLRVLLGQASDRADEVTGVVHVRDTLTLAPDAPAAQVARASFHVRVDEPVYEALARMRETRNHLAVVGDADGKLVGVVTLGDVLAQLFPLTTTPSTPSSSPQSK